LKVAWEDMETGEEVENIVTVIDPTRVGELITEADVVFSF